MNQDNLPLIRHSLAHLLAQATLKHYPTVQLTLGPAIDTGFYYDMDFVGGEKIGPEDLIKIEKSMKELLPSWTTWEHKEVTQKEAEEIFAGNVYKLELIKEIVDRGEKITLYTCGGFTDLCRGGHCEETHKIDPKSFKLDRVAGAYWRGDEKNKMITRIYGLAFATGIDLDAYIVQQEEAKKRDHKILGQELDLFTFSPLVGPGLPLWTPKGTLVRNLLDAYVWSMREMRGYEKVEIPHITKKDLYVTSGHWEKYQDDLFKITTREGHEFAMKPMNCPHHTQIYDRKQWSYKELPQRYANTTTCYRDEQSGELSGLSRVRAFAQDDAHVFCRLIDAETEFLKIWDIIQEFYKTFGFELKVRISKHDPEHVEKYLGNPENWKYAEDMLTKIAKDKKANAYDGIGEAAFYGPKLDFMAHDAIGREWQVATIQLDMNMPERFDLSCTNEKGEKERIVMIHAAIMGSIERFLSILIEHTAGSFPVWLSPVQVGIIPVKEVHEADTDAIVEKLLDAGIRIEHIKNNDSLGKRIHQVKKWKTPYVVIYGDKEKESGILTIETRSGEKISLTLEQFIAQIQNETKERTLN